MRGKACHKRKFRCGIRITPAYAGKSFPQNRINIFVKDHPRLCGEKLNGTNGAECVIGSPPPMRGKVAAGHPPPETRQDHPRLCGEKLWCCCWRCRIVWITPAYAGKRLFTKKESRKVWDHPRLCGEKCSDHIFEQVFVGSPPPMRGKVVLTVAAICNDRITPAYAGKSAQKYRMRFL